MANLQLPLKKQWFELTKSGIKTEDYREITPYWVKRLLVLNFTQEQYEGLIINELIDDLKIINTEKAKHDSVSTCLWYFCANFRNFDSNIMTLGYPKSTDSDRILKLEHKGIEIREGNPEWGAIPGRKYFVILHGSFLK